MSSKTIRKRYNTIHMAKLTMYKLKGAGEYMVKTNINLDLMRIKDSSMISFIVLFCLGYSTWLEANIMELLPFNTWFYNRVLRTLDSNCKWLTWNLSKTWNKVFLANIPLLWIQPLQFFDWYKWTFFIFS